jgi:hypothetical protein
MMFIGVVLDRNLNKIYQLHISASCMSTVFVSTSNYSLIKFYYLHSYTFLCKIVLAVISALCLIDLIIRCEAYCVGSSLFCCIGTYFICLLFPHVYFQILSALCPWTPVLCVL